MSFVEKLHLVSKNEIALQSATIMSQSTSTARREFIKFLAASPYVAALGGVAAFFEQSGLAQSMQETSDVITSPAGAFDVFDFEEAAHRKVLQGHWAYMASGVDDDATLRANREGFKHIELRPRRLRDATKVDMHVDLFGTTYNSPIFLCPTGGEKSFFADGELSVARAAKARGHFAVSVHGNLDARRRGEQRTRPAGLVSTVRNDLLGRERENSAARGSRGVPGRRTHGR